MTLDTKVGREAPVWVLPPETDSPESPLMKFATQLVLKPQSEDRNQESINKRMRIAGISLLAADENKGSLDRYLGGGSGHDRLVDILMDNFEQDLTMFDKPERFKNPTGFTTIQSIYLGLGLKDSQSDAGQRIYRLALARSTDPEIKKAVEVMATIPGYEYITDRFE